MIGPPALPTLYSSSRCSSNHGTLPPRLRNCNFLYPRWTPFFLTLVATSATRGPGVFLSSATRGPDLRDKRTRVSFPVEGLVEEIPAGEWLEEQHAFWREYWDFVNSRDPSKQEPHPWDAEIDELFGGRLGEDGDDTSDDSSVRGRLEEDGDDSDDSSVGTTAMVSQDDSDGIPGHLLGDWDSDGVVPVPEEVSAQSPAELSPAARTVDHCSRRWGQLVAATDEEFLSQAHSVEERTSRDFCDKLMKFRRRQFWKVLGRLHLWQAFLGRPISQFSENSRRLYVGYCSKTRNSSDIEESSRNDFLNQKSAPPVSQNPARDQFRRRGPRVHGTVGAGKQKQKRAKRRDRAAHDRSQCMEPSTSCCEQDSSGSTSSQSAAGAPPHFLILKRPGRVLAGCCCFAAFLHPFLLFHFVLNHWETQDCTARWPFCGSSGYRQPVLRRLYRDSIFALARAQCQVERRLFYGGGVVGGAHDEDAHHDTHVDHDALPEEPTSCRWLQQVSVWRQDRVRYFLLARDADSGSCGGANDDHVAILAQGWAIVAVPEHVPTFWLVRRTRQYTQPLPADHEEDAD